MNKISKKIVALVTMAAFVLTLVPAAAFAAPGDVSVQTSAFNIVDSNNNALTEKSVTVNDELTGLFDLQDASDKDATGKADVRIWALEGGQVTDALVVKDGTAAVTNAGPASAATGGKVYLVTNAQNAQTVKVSFTRPGTYTVYAGTVAPTAGDGSGATKLAKSTTCTITVNDVETYVDSIALVDGQNDTVTYSGVADGATVGATVTVQINNKYAADDEDAPAQKDQEVAISADSMLKVTKANDASKTSVNSLKTDANGQIKFDVIGEAGMGTRIYPITLTCGDKSYTVKVSYTAEAQGAAKVEVVDTGKTVVATDASNLGDVAQVAFKDASGNLTTGTASVYTAAQPEGSNVTFKLADTQTDAKTYKLEVQSGSLKVGEYTVGVTLAGKNTVELTFTVEKFGKVVDSKIVVKAQGSSEAVTDVYDNTTYTATVYVVDENGLEIPATSAKGYSLAAGITAGQDALVNGKIDVTSLAANGEFTFTVNDDKKDDDNALIGTKINFIAFDNNKGVNATAEVVVADSANKEKAAIVFDKENGEVKTNNTVKVSLVDGNGDVYTSANSAKVYYTVVSSSNEDAKVNVYGPETLTKGEASLTLYSDKETVAEILVTVIDKKGVVYGNTLKYTFGEQDIPVDTSIVMTIGSNDFIVNNDVVSVEDAAPYVANDRTYVPFRALGEALGAKVVWDNDARTVTYTLGKTEVVMTIGEKTYTVNGEEKTMDVAPEITNDRTYVPVRFVGEALGFKVTALSAADGTTASVVFQK